jgi:ferrous iron transport protein A
MSQVTLDAAAYRVVTPEECEACEFAEVCTLNLLGVGRCGRVLAVGGDPSVRRRLMEMGFCNAAHVEVVRRAPLGDPIEFRLRGYYLSLRHDQARHIRIQPVLS